MTNGDTPEIRYAKSGDVYLGYQVWGDGPIDVLEMNNGANFSIDATADEPHWLRYERRLSSFCRLVRYDPRGFGLSDSDPVGADYSFDPWIDDALAVLDAAGVERAAVVTGVVGGFAAMDLAAQHPERISALVLINGTARIVWDEDYPAGLALDLTTGLADAPARAAADGAGAFDDVALLAPSLAADPEFRLWWERATKRSASPTVAHAVNRAIFSADRREVLGRISVPTLVVVRRDFALGTDQARYVADHIRGAQYVEVPGADLLPFAGEIDALLDEVEEFLTGERTTAEAQRVLATVVFTDVVGSTALAAEMGDRRWKALLDDVQDLARRELDRHRGRLVKDTGDGTLSTFPSPAGAIRCALAVREGARHLGVEVRAGVHAGEVEVRGEDIGGIAVHVAARVAALAEPGEVWVSETVADLVAGSGIDFTDRGVHALKGIPGERRLLAVAG